MKRRNFLQALGAALIGTSAAKVAKAAEWTEPSTGGATPPGVLESASRIRVVEEQLDGTWLDVPANEWRITQPEEVGFICSGWVNAEGMDAALDTYVAEDVTPVKCSYCGRTMHGMQCEGCGAWL